jgi:hypothetical protein
VTMVVKAESLTKRSGKSPMLLLARTRSHLAGPGGLGRHFSSGSPMLGSSSRRIVAPQATEQKRRLSTSEFRFGSIV